MQGGGTVLRLGVGSPSTMGCANLRGTSVRFRTLFGSPVSVLTAMRELDLHMVGLPGARLPTGFASSGLVVFARGALGSYSSTAVVWRMSLGSGVVAPLPTLGSDRRAWVRIQGSHTLYWGTPYLPPTNQGAEDTEWRSEMDGLDKDVEEIYKLEAGCPGDDVRILIMGDINMQPSALQGGIDARPTRDEQVTPIMALAWRVQ